MKKIIPTSLQKGYSRFKNTYFSNKKSLFEKLADGQSPETMVISCADSRVYATEIFDANAGDLFVIRNIAGLVAPFCEKEGDLSVAAALEFAVGSLKVKNIVVLGHQNCGGVRACAEHYEKGHVGAWVKQLKVLREKIWDSAKSESDNLQNLEQASVKRSLDNLKTYPFIQKAMAENRLSIYGGWVTLEKVELYWLKEGFFKRIEVDKS